jgi:hypothetical protein
MLLEAKGVERKLGPKQDIDTVSEIAAALGVNERTAYRCLAQADAYESLPDSFPAVGLHEDRLAVSIEQAQPRTVFTQADASAARNDPAPPRAAVE